MKNSKIMLNCRLWPLYLYVKSLEEDLLPSLWKTSIVVPLFKNGSRSNPLNYRPVSLTSACCKSLERIIVSQLTEYLEANGLLSGNQFGFRKGRSVEDQLLLTYAEVANRVDSGSVDMIFSRHLMLTTP